MRAVIYARFSSDGQQEESITAQLRACQEFAEKYNYDVVGEYIDRAISGKTDKRPDFQAMIKDSQKNKFDIVLVHKYDRFARKVYDHAVYEKALNDNNVQLIAVAENFGQGKEAVLMKGLMQSLSEYYILNLSGEVKKGHKEKALQALHNGGVPPFGYDVVNGQYVINELEASYVYKLFEACKYGRGYKSILSEMDALGITGKRGKPLRYSSVYEILRNEKYTGVYLYCPTEIKDRSKRRSKEGAIRIEDAIPAIVNRETWVEVQKIMDSRKNTGKIGKREYLLTGLVTCECGAPMHAITTQRKGHEYSYFYCSKKCGNRNVRVDQINEYVFDYLGELLSEESKALFADALQTYQREIHEAVTVSEDVLKCQISNKERQIDNIMQNMRATVLPPIVLENLGKQISELTEQIEVLNIELLNAHNFSDVEIKTWLTAVGNLTAQPESIQKATIKRFIKNVEITKNSVNVTSTFTELLSKLKIDSLGKVGCGGALPCFPKHFFGKSYKRRY